MVPSRALRILLVEDNVVNQRLACALLARGGHAVTVAWNGREALDRLDEAAFDLVLMDVQMPEMDGLQATAAIRERERGTDRRVPIVALTASAVIGERERCQAAGMDDLLTKPVNADRLGSVLRTYAGGVRRPARTDGEEDAPRGAVLDPSRIEELTDMGERAKVLVLRAMDNFVTRAPDVLTELREALERADAAALRAVAHAFRGSALNLGANRAAEVALDLELKAEEGTVDGCGRTVDELATTLDATVAALTAYRQLRLVG